jgi:hypothetical protein
VAGPLIYSLGDIVILDVSSWKYLGIIVFCSLSWADQVNYMFNMAWKAIHFTMHILKKINVALRD